MQYFHLDQPLDEMVLCDREDCEGIADYLEVDDDGSEPRLCGLHTRSEKYAALLSMRTPSPDPPYRSRPVI
jgi:hypothetical protein